MAIYVITKEDSDSTGGSYITEAGIYVFKTSNVIHKVNQRDGTDLFECTFVTKDGATMRKTFFWGDISKPTSEYKARALIFMYLKACGVHIFRDQLDTEDAAGFYEIVKDKKFTAKVDMKPDQYDPNKTWAEIGFSGFVYDQSHVLYKEGTTKVITDDDQVIDNPW